MAGVAKVRPYRGIEASERLDQRRRRFLDAGLIFSAPKWIQTVSHRPRGLPTVGPDRSVFLRELHRQGRVRGRRFRRRRRRHRGHHTGGGRRVSARRADPRRHRQPGPHHQRRLPHRPGVVRRPPVESGDLCASAPTSAGFSQCCRLSTAESALHRDQNSRTRATINFVVGGVGQTLSAWLSGEIDLNQDQLIDQITAISMNSANPELYRD